MLCCFFFFQAVDGIRDRTVTGVQTCALPISPAGWSSIRTSCWSSSRTRSRRRCSAGSEERRVGKECRSRWSPDQLKKKAREKSSSISVDDVVGAGSWSVISGFLTVSLSPSKILYTLFEPVWRTGPFIFFFSSRRRHTSSYGDWSSDVCSSDLEGDRRDRRNRRQRPRADPLEQL